MTTIRMLKCGVAAAAISLSVVAHAQETNPQQGTSAAEPAAEDSVAVGDIVVTAQRRSESINRVPLAIQAFDASSISKLGLTSAAAIAQSVPGFTFAKSQGNTPVYTIRGVGFQTRNMTSTSPVGIYVDEVAYAYPYMSNDVAFDLERVEVLKGPQGTLYGRNTTGGLVNFIAAKPTDELRMGLNLTAGNYETLNAEAFVSGPLGGGFSGRIAVKSDYSGKGWQRSASRPGDRLGEVNRLAARGSLAYDEKGPFTALLTLSYWRDRSDTQQAQGLAYIPSSPAFAIPGAQASIPASYANNEAEWTPASGQVPDQFAYRADARFYGIMARLRYELNDNLALISLTSYNDVKRDDANDQDGLVADILRSRNTGRIKSFSQELRLTGEGDRYNWTVGASYSRDWLREDQVAYGLSSASVELIGLALGLKLDPAAVAGALGLPPPAIPGFVSLANALTAPYSVDQVANGFAGYSLYLKENFEGKGIFANGHYELTDQLGITAGVRYSKDDLRFEGCSRDLNNLSNPVLVPVFGALFVQNVISNPAGGCLTLDFPPTGLILVKRRLQQDNVAFRGSLEFKPTPESLIYASFSQGYKSGAFPVVPALIETQLDPIGQERVRAYEIGAKSRLGRIGQLNVAGFYYDYTDKQLLGRISDPIFTTVPAIVNIPSSRVWGLEASLTARPVQALTVTVGGAYINSKIKRYQGFSEFGQPFDFAGHSFTYTPEWSGNASIAYEQPVSSQLQLTAVVDGRYQSASSGSLTGNPLFRIAPYAIINARLELGALDDSWKAGLFVRNLTDKNYSTGTEFSNETVINYTGMPRTYGLTLSYKYR